MPFSSSSSFHSQYNPPPEPLPHGAPSLECFLIFTGCLCFCPRDVTSPRVQESNSPGPLPSLDLKRGPRVALLFWRRLSDRNTHARVRGTPSGSPAPLSQHNTTQRRRPGRGEELPANPVRRPPTRSAFHEAGRRRPELPMSNRRRAQGPCGVTRGFGILKRSPTTCAAVGPPKHFPAWYHQRGTRAAGQGQRRGDAAVRRARPKGLRRLHPAGRAPIRSKNR